MAFELSGHFDYRRLLCFSGHTVAMSLFTSIYEVVDGFFVSNYVGKDAFSALNLIYPFIQILASFGVMLGVGGCALVAKTLGEGKKDLANRLFSMVVTAIIVVGCVGAAVGFVCTPYVAQAFGATGRIFDDSVTYGQICVTNLVPWTFQIAFQSLFTAAARPQYGFFIMLAAGCVNFALDALFILGFGWGIEGAAFATVLSRFVGGGVPVIYFLRKHNTSMLRLVRPAWNFKALVKASTNGLSELVTYISAAGIMMVFNYQLMRFIGPDGVAAFGVILYIIYIAEMTFTGFAMGVGPIISYHFGAQNTDELKSLFRKAFTVIASLNLFFAASSFVFREQVVGIFVGYDQELFELTLYAFEYYCVTLLLMGFPVFGSAFFTALNDGLTSGSLSFLRTFVFGIGMVLLLPYLFGPNGIWFAALVSEVCACIATLVYVVLLRKKYGYG